MDRGSQSTETPASTFGMVPNSHSRHHQHLHSLSLPDSSLTPSCLDPAQTMTNHPQNMLGRASRLKLGDNSTFAPAGFPGSYGRASNPVHPTLGSQSDALPQHSPKQVKSQQCVEPPTEPQVELHTTPRDYFDLRINDAESHFTNTSAATPAELMNLTPSSFRQTETPSGYYTHTFQGKPVTVITDARYISHAIDGDTMFGLTPNALAWLEQMQEIPPDPTRRPIYPPFSQLKPHQRMMSLAEAQQHREAQTQAQRVAPFADPTLAQVQANAPKLVEDWYTAVIDLSQTRDNAHALGCCYLTRRAGNGQLYTTPKAIMMLFWKMLDIIIDGVTNGHLKTTNVNQMARMRSRGFRSGLYAQQIIDDAIQSIRMEKMILVDLLGPGGQECMENLIWSPKGYADVKLYDRTSNMMRKFGGKKSMGERTTTTVEIPPSVPRNSRTPDQGLLAAEAFATSPSQQPSGPTPANQTRANTTPSDRPSSLFPPWPSLPTTSLLTTPAAASAHQRALSQRSRAPPPAHPDPNLAAFRTHLPIFAAHLYTAVVSVSHAQDNPSSHAHARFVRAPYAFAAPDRADTAVRAIQSTCLRFCHALAEAAARGYDRPTAALAGAAPQLARHRGAFLAAVLHGDEATGGADVLQRFGAVCEVVRREKTVADAFRSGGRELGLAELVWEPFAFGMTKGAHRRSNRARVGGGAKRGAEGVDGARRGSAAPAKERRRGEGEQVAGGDGGGGGVLVWARGDAQRAEGLVEGVARHGSAVERAWDADARPAFRVKRQRLSAAGGGENVIDLRPMHSRKQRRDGGQYIKVEDPEPCNPFAYPPIQAETAGPAYESSGLQPFQHHGLPFAMLLIGMGGLRNNGDVKNGQQLEVEQDVSTLMGDILAESPD